MNNIIIYMVKINQTKVVILFDIFIAFPQAFCQFTNYHFKILMEGSW